MITPVKNEANALPLNAESRLRELDRIHGVINDVEDPRGWHLVEAEIYKLGVYRIFVSNRLANGAVEFHHGFARQSIITTAREVGYLSAPNGYTLP